MDLDLSLTLKIQRLEEGYKSDIISRLPDEIRLQILNRLPENNAVATSILSKKWKDAWAFLPDLHFVMPGCVSDSDTKSFMDFVERILTLRNGMTIKRFTLSLAQNCDYARVYRFLCIVINCNVEELVLGYPSEGVRINLPWYNLIHCNSLVVLTLRGQFVLDVPVGVLFPSLKDLKLLSIIYSGDASFVNLIAGCPVLEKLYVERQSVNVSDNLTNFCLSIPSLKVLRISFAQYANKGHKFELDTPNLEELFLVDLMTDEFLFKTMPSIRFAKINIMNGDAPVLLQSVSAARSLTLNFYILRLLGSAQNRNDIPIFESLVTFTYDNLKNWRMVLLLLQRMPNLEELILGRGQPLMPSSEPINIYLPANVPACVLSTLATVKICNSEALTELQVTLIRYLLCYGRSLKTVTINRHNIDPKRERRLLRSVRGSKSCEVILI